MSENAFQAPSPESLAELLPQYDVEFFIAQGGMGAVYKGRQLSLDRDIAIKVLPHEVGESEEFRESFISEAKAMARLNHTNLLGVFDYGTVDGMPYIVMEYVDGGSLHQAAYNQAVEPMQAVVIVKGICDGLTHAHEHGIVHRDIKPSNILLTQKAEPKVADFGLAHAADSDKPGLVMGTPGYTAPEVFHDPNQAGARADIYSVGVILHQLLTGIDPAGSMEPPTQPCGSFRLDVIWRKATHMDPGQRYASVEAISADLEKWMAAKRKTAGVLSPSPLHKPRSPVQVAAEEGGGFMGKLVVIGVLFALVVFAYQFLRAGKEEIRNDTADSQEMAPPVAIAPIPAPASPQPVSLPTEDVKPTFEPEPIDTAANEEPVPVAVLDKEPEPSGNLEPGDPQLRERAISLIAEARKKRDKELSDNASALHFSLKDSPAKEESIDGKHLSELTRIRDAYVTRLKGAADETSDKGLKERLVAQAEEGGDLAGWIGSLTPEPDRVVRRSSGAVSGSFAGNWDIHSEGRVSRWTAHPNGRMEIIGQTWEAFWEVVDDGSLEVMWTGKKRPYKLTRDGEDWIGKSPFGHAVTLKRGNW